MKNILLILSMLYLNFAFTQSYNLKTQSESLNWTGKAAFDTYSLTGTIDAEKGSLIKKGDALVQMTIIINMKSLNHENRELKNHLRGKDFFEVKKYSKAVFILTQPSIIKNGIASLTGNFTIKNNTKTETFAANVLVQEEGSITIAPKLNINRTNYGVEYNSPTIFESIKKNAIADDFELEGTLIFNTSNW